MTIQAVDDIAIIKSIEYEVRNYKYWYYQHDILVKKIEELLSRLYDIKAVSYDKPMNTNDATRREHLLVEWIVVKDELYEQLNLIQLKKDFVDDILEKMEEEDRNFIYKALVERSYYDTNDSIAMRMGLTESGVRYKVDVILRKVMKTVLSRKED